MFAAEILLCLTKVCFSDITRDVEYLFKTRKILYYKIRLAPKILDKGYVPVLY